MIVPSKQFQVKAIANQLRKRGIEPDLVDLHSIVDSSLTLRENYNIVMREYGFGRGKSYAPKNTRSTNKVNNFLSAQGYFNKLSSKRQEYDSKKKAKTIFEMSNLTNKNYKKWKKRPNHYDIKDVDYIMGYSR